MVTFTEIPQNYRIPGVFTEISPRNPRPTGSVSRILLVGGFHDAASTVSNVSKGTATDKQPVLVTSAAEADTLFGTNSVLSNQFRVARANAPFSEIWVYPIDVGNAAVAASSQPSLDVTANTDVTGTLVVQVNGVNYSIPLSVDGGSDTNVVSTNVGAAITSYFSNISNFPVRVTNSGRDVTFTARNAGVIGNQFTLAVNDSGVSGLTISGVANFAGGTGTIFATDWDDGLNDVPFDTIVMPSYFDDGSAGTTGIDAINSRVDGRWLATGAEYGLYGHVWAAIKGTASEIVTAIGSRNEPHESVVGVESTNPTPEYVVGAAYAATAHRSLTGHPARPFTGLQVNTIYPAAINSNRFNRTARNSLLNAGVSTIQYVNEQSVIERSVTTDTSAGDTWRQAQIPYTLMVVLRRYRQWIQTNYEGALLVDELPKDTNNGAFGIQAGNRVVTPKTVKGDFIGLYRDLALELLVEDVESFRVNLIVERAMNDQSKLQSNLPLNLANGLIQFPILVDFTA